MPSTKHDTKFEYLLDKGLMILWAKGYNGTSVNDIVKAADIPKGSFYFYFKSKEDFAVKAIERYFEVYFTPAFKILGDESKSPKIRLIEFFEQRVMTLKEDLHCKMGCLLSNLGNEMAEHSEKIRLIILGKTNAAKAQISKVARQAQEAGEINTSIDPESLVEFLGDALKGAMISMKEMQSASPLDNLVTIIKTIFLK